MLQYAWILWDLAAVLVLLWLVHGGAYKGFIRTVISAASYFIAAAAASALSPLAARWLYDNLVHDLLRVTLESRLETLLEKGADTAASLGDLLPGILRAVAAQSDLAPDTLLRLGGTQLVQELLTVALEGPAISILRGIAFFVLFGAALFVTRQFARLFTGVYRIPLLGAVNTLLGGVLGALEGALALYLLALALQLAVLLTGNSLAWLNSRILDDTYLLRFFLLLHTP